MRKLFAVALRVIPRRHGELDGPWRRSLANLLSLKCNEHRLRCREENGVLVIESMAQ